LKATTLAAACTGLRWHSVCDPPWPRSFAGLQRRMHAARPSRAREPTGRWRRASALPPASSPQTAAPLARPWPNCRTPGAAVDKCCWAESLSRASVAVRTRTQHVENCCKILATVMLQCAACSVRRAMPGGANWRASKPSPRRAAVCVCACSVGGRKSAQHSGALACRPRGASHIGGKCKGSGGLARLLRAVVPRTTVTRHARAERGDTFIGSCRVGRFRQAGRAILAGDRRRRSGGDEIGALRFAENGLPWLLTPIACNSPAF
jgi:hypothetical protein